MEVVYEQVCACRLCGYTTAYPVRLDRYLISWRPVWSRAQEYMSTTWPFSAALLARPS